LSKAVLPAVILNGIDVEKRVMEPTHYPLLRGMASHRGSVKEVFSAFQYLPRLLLMDNEEAGEKRCADHDACHAIDKRPEEEGG
jgi:hypothetical protein